LISTILLVILVALAWIKDLEGSTSGLGYNVGGIVILWNILAGTLFFIGFGILKLIGYQSNFSLSLVNLILVVLSISIAEVFSQVALFLVLTNFLVLMTNMGWAMINRKATM